MFSVDQPILSYQPTYVLLATGAKTQLAGFITAMVVMMVLLFMTKVFELLPYAVMAAIIISGVAGLVEFDTAAYLFRTHLRDFAVWMVAFVSTLFLGIELGLAVSIGLALLIVIFESAFPHTAMLGRVDRSTVYRNIEQVKRMALLLVCRGLCCLKPLSILLVRHSRPAVLVPVREAHMIEHDGQD